MAVGKRRRGQRKRHVLALAFLPCVLAGLFSACSDPYPIAATACDDFCYATQRAGCSEDYPEGCVSACERDGPGRRYPHCQDLWHQLTACYRSAPDSAFECVADESRPRDLCLAERAALAECASEGAALCVRNCFHQASACNENAAECEADCYTPPPGCQPEQVAYDTCALEAPVYCGTQAEDTRRPEDIPCSSEIVSLLACAGFF
jgi:hypothetical protein